MDGIPSTFELAPQKKRIFVTQLRDEDEEEDTFQDLQKIPIVKEKAGNLIEMGYKTLQKTLLLKREVQVNALDIELCEKKKEFKERMTLLKQTGHEIKKKEKVLKQRKEKFAKFIEENNAKKERALMKLKEEGKMKLRNIGEYKRLEMEMIKMKEKLEKVKIKLKKYKIYKDYLCSVIEVLPEDYMETSDNMIDAFMLRYETLLDTSEKLHEKQQKLQYELQSCTNTFQGLSMKQSEDLLAINQELSSTQNTLDNFIKENAKVETKTETEKQSFVMDSEMKARIVLAIHNIADRCTARKNMIDVSQLDIFGKLDLIAHFFNERKAVLEMSRPDPEKTSSQRPTINTNSKSRSNQLSVSNTTESPERHHSSSRISNKSVDDMKPATKKRQLKTPLNSLRTHDICPIKEELDILR